MGPKVVVTGGSGYIGGRVAKGLKAQGFNVAIFDIAEPKIGQDKFDAFVRGDICDGDSLRRAFRDADAVVHAAGFGLSGRDNFRMFDEVTRRVNVEGTENVVQAAKECGVKALVFTSTLNIGFTGRPLLNVTEAEVDEIIGNNNGSSYIDEYSRTKHKAENIVLNESGNDIKKCALRLGGVYGPGEGWVMPRSIRYMESGLMDWGYCLPEDLKIDFLHVDNAVQAHVKAVELLLDDNASSKVNGHVFNITDGTPMSLATFLEPLHRAMFDNRPINPMFNFPPITVVAFAYILQLVTNTISFLSGGRWRLPMPFWGLTPMEAYKITVSHYFSLTKSSTLLGYEPVVEQDRQWRELLQSYGIEAVPKTAKNNFYTRISRDESAESEQGHISKMLFALPLIIAICCKMTGMEIF